MENRGGTRLKRTWIHYSSGVSGERIASIQSVSVRLRRNHLNVSNLARTIEEPPSSILSCGTMFHTMVSSRDVVEDETLLLFLSFDQPSAGARFTELTVESQLSLQKVARTVSPVSSDCL